MMHPKIRSLTRICAPALAAGQLLAGCASSIPRRVEAVRTPMGGATWNLVMPSPEVQDAQAAGDWEHSRNNGVLAARSNDPRLASSEWPEDPQPSLDDARRLSLPQNSNSVLYYSDERREWRRRSTGGWWYGQ